VLAARDDEGVSQPEDPVGSLPHDCLERAVELTDGADLHREQLHFERASHGLRVTHLDREDRIARKYQGRDARQMRDELF